MNATISKLAIMLLLIAGFGVSQAEIRFSNITDTCGLGNFRAAGYGVSIVDFNADSLQDIFVVGHQGQNRLFMNTGSMQFVDITSLVGLAGNGSGWGVCYGDFDSDYDEDIYVSNRDNGRNQLFVFDNGAYTDRAQQLHADDPGGYGYSACFAPFTKSRCLDLVSVNQAWDGHRQSCKFLAGSSSGVFTDITAYAGLADSSLYWDCASACNYDNDGDLDLLVSGESFNRLYNNNGHGFFADFSDSALINQPRDSDTSGYGITWGDYNNDGNMDYYISYWHAQYGEMFRNNGDGTFTDVTSSLGLGQEVWCHSVSFGDFDNDGWLDLYSVSASYGNKLYKNNLGIAFTEISEEAGVEDYGYGCGLGVGDLDGDGKLDMVIGHYANPNRMAYLYRNMTVNDNNWIEIKINGFPPNPDGIGARVRLFTGSIVQTREVSGGSGFGSQNMLPLHFGLGTATTVDSLIITYPNTRIAPIKYRNLGGNAYYELPDIVIDAAGVGILQPQLQDYETPLYPEISFTNRGTVDLMQVKTACNLIANGVRQQIDSAYIQFFAQGDTTVVEYLDYSLPRCRQTYTLEGIITTNGDRQRQNDTVSTTFYAGYYHDLDCRFANISHPESLVINMPPRVVLTNVGITPESSIPVRCRIWLNDSLLYSEDYHYATTLSPLSRDTLLFPSFDPTGPGRYRVSVYSMLASDQDRSNDTSSYEIELGGSGCNYVIGDINNSGRANGVDIVYAVRYFKGGEAPPYICDCPTVGPLYVAGDVNGSCTFNGADITYMVNFFKGGATLTMCPYCMPGGMKR